jgi:hypothetical protein
VVGGTATITITMKGTAMNLQQTAKQHPLIAAPLALSVATTVLIGTLGTVSILQEGATLENVVSLVSFVTALSFAVWFWTFLPGIIAWYRKHPLRVGVAWMCLLGWLPFFGWVFWIGLMFYAVLSPVNRSVAVAYGEGSVVNGHVLRDGRWVQLTAPPQLDMTDRN